SFQLGNVTDEVGTGTGRVTEDGHLTLIGPDQAERDLDERALARSVRTHDGKRPPGFEVEADVAQRFDPPVADGHFMYVHRRARRCHACTCGGAYGISPC